MVFSPNRESLSEMLAALPPNRVSIQPCEPRSGFDWDQRLVTTAPSSGACACLERAVQVLHRARTNLISLAGCLRLSSSLQLRTRKAGCRNNPAIPATQIDADLEG